MTIIIDKKITGYALADPASKAGTENATEAAGRASTTADVIQMHETLERPEMLVGSTYKLKTPAVSEHAMYITINDIVLNEGTPHELRRPFEVFINSKNLDHFQWIVALTRIMSAVFRKGGDVTFLVEELRSVFDPRGGYWNKGKYMPSIIAEIGDVIENHLIRIGMLKAPELDAHQQQLINSKREEIKARQANDASPDDAAGEALHPEGGGSAQFPENATFCAKCNHKSAIVMDGCVTCLNCGDSKCG